MQNLTKTGSEWESERGGDGGGACDNATSCQSRQLRLFHFSSSALSNNRFVRLGILKCAPSAPLLSLPLCLACSSFSIRALSHAVAYHSAEHTQDFFGSWLRSAFISFSRLWHVALPSAVHCPLSTVHCPPSVSCLFSVYVFSFPFLFCFCLSLSLFQS